MKLITLCFTLFCASLFSVASFADSQNLKITMTLVNQSNETLSYNGFSNSNPENIFLVSPRVIMPGAKVTITALSSDLNFADLSGDIHFDDSHGKDHVFHLTDPQQMHYGKTTYEKSLAHLSNDRPAPLALAYSSLI